MVKKTALFCMTLLAALLTPTAEAAVYRVSDVPNVHVQNRDRYLSDPDGIISAAARDRADTIMAGIWQRTSAEVVAVVVDSIDTGDIDGFATELFTLWGIGKADNDNGLLVLVAKGDRGVTIRTGYGMEGTLPDILAGRIIRSVMIPQFRRGDYDTGLLEALEALSEIITDPEAADGLMSKYANDAAADEQGGFFDLYFTLACIATVALLVWFLAVFCTGLGLDRFERYRKLERLRAPTLFFTFLCLGMPLVAYIPLTLAMRRLRNAPRKCPNCSAKMRKVDEEHDNDYLTPAQDLEERIDSIDYDVWLCPDCGETDIYPFVNKQKSYTRCERCGARTVTQKGNRILQSPTVTREGRGVKEYICCNCHNVTSQYYTIAKLPPPVIFIPGGGGRGFGGGISGGSFGGGMTGGGGATGHW